MSIATLSALSVPPPFVASGDSTAAECAGRTKGVDEMEDRVMSTASNLSPDGECRDGLKIRVYPIRLRAWAPRFWKHVDTSAGVSACWPWTGARKTKGYGLFRVEPKPAAPRTASRLAYSLAHDGAEPKVVRHTCDNPPCCNPAHLVDGAQANNILDGVKRGRIHPRWTPAPEKLSVDLTQAEHDRLHWLAAEVLAGRMTLAEAERLAVRL